MRITLESGSEERKGGGDNGQCYSHMEFCNIVVSGSAAHDGLSIAQELAANLEVDIWNSNAHIPLGVHQWYVEGHSWSSRGAYELKTIDKQGTFQEFGFLLHKQPKMGSRRTKFHQMRLSKHGEFAPRCSVVSILDALCRLSSIYSRDGRVFRLTNWPQGKELRNEDTEIIHGDRKA